VSSLIAPLLLGLASASNLYGFTEFDGNQYSDFVRLDPRNGSLTALWRTSLSIEPYVAALDVPRSIVYTVFTQHTVTGIISSLVALSMEDGTQHFNVSLPFGQYSPTAGTRKGVGHSAGTRSGTLLDVDPRNGDVLVGGLIQSAIHWKPSTECSPACNASLCCIDPQVGGAACFDQIKQCADISEPAGLPQYRQYRLSTTTRKLLPFQHCSPYWTVATKTGSSALDIASRTLYVQLQQDPGGAPVSGVLPMEIFSYDIDTGNISSTINVTAAVVEAAANDSAIFDFEDMNFDPVSKRLLSVSLGIVQSTGFFRYIIELDPVSQKLTRLAPNYFDFKHHDRIGVDSVLDPVAHVVYEFLPTNDVELVGYSTETGEVAVDVNITSNLNLFPNNLELGP